jgi:hypothetical protein
MILGFLSASSMILPYPCQNGYGCNGGCQRLLKKDSSTILISLANCSTADGLRDQFLKRRVVAHTPGSLGTAFPQYRRVGRTRSYTLWRLLVHVRLAMPGGGPAEAR